MIQLALQETILWGVPTSFITAFIFNIILVAVAVLLSFGISKKIGGKLRWLWFVLLLIGFTIAYFALVSLFGVLISLAIKQ